MARNPAHRTGHDLDKPHIVHLSEAEVTEPRGPLAYYCRSVNEDELITAIRSHLSNDTRPTEARGSEFTTQVQTMDLGALLGSLGSVAGDLARLLGDPLNPPADVVARADAFGVSMGTPAAASVPGPIAPADLERAEQRLGVELPGLLRRLYLEVANGGFGPGFGLLGLPPGGWTDDKGADLVTLLERNLDLPDDWGEDRWRWPRHYLPIAYHGDVVYAALDLSRDGAPVLDYDPSGLDWDDDDYPVDEDEAFDEVAPSFLQWLVDWLER